MDKHFYVTTPIYYPSAKLHIGHAYTTIAGDVIARYKKQNNYKVFYLTGTDEHGQKIETIAKKNQQEPKEYVDEIVVDIKKLWKKLNINYDKFIRTTDKKHEEIVKNIFTKLLDQGDIYLGKYEGLYCKSDEAYYTETQLKNGKCPDCGNTLENISEETYFFKCSKYIDRLKKFYENNPNFLEPEYRLKELINNFITPGLEDLSISRTSFSWGIKINENPDHVIYVWLDALTNYITALGYNTEKDDNFKKYWPADVQLVGKEIIRFHVIYWPMILMALDLPLPKKIYAHGWLLMDNDKMSKSKGNVIYPNYLSDEYGEDTVRYYLLREVPFGNDGQFTASKYIKRINTDLVNDLSNLVNRTVVMANKYFNGVIEYNEYSNENILNHQQNYKIMQEKFISDMDKYRFSYALDNLWQYISLTNKFIDLEEPWVLAKDDNTNLHLKKVIWILLNSIEKISFYIYSVMPTMSKMILRNLRSEREEENMMFDELININEKKYEVLEEPNIIYQRLNENEEIAKINEKMESDIKNAKAKI